MQEKGSGMLTYTCTVHMKVQHFDDRWFLFFVYMRSVLE